MLLLGSTEAVKRQLKMFQSYIVKGERLQFSSVWVEQRRDNQKLELDAPAPPAEKLRVFQGVRLAGARLRS